MEGGPEIIEEEYERDEVQQTESKREKERERESERDPHISVGKLHYWKGLI